MCDSINNTNLPLSGYPVPCLIDSDTLSFSLSQTGSTTAITMNEVQVQREDVRRGWDEHPEVVGEQDEVESSVECQFGDLRLAIGKC